MHELTLNFVQALQFSALPPCLFIVALLFIISRERGRILIAALYFLSLSASFLIPLLAMFPRDESLLLLATAKFIESLQPALCFLLIIQFITGKNPPSIYWLILCVPIIGGSWLVYGELMVDEMCFLRHICVTTKQIHSYYTIFSTALIFLLLVVHFYGGHERGESQDRYRQQKYWLVMALILLNLGLLANDLALLAKAISHNEFSIIATVVRLSFIYLVITSLFRIFDDKVSAGMVVMAKKAEVPVDPELIERLIAAMQKDKLYREMSCSRESLAQYVNVAEYVLSRAINQQFDKNFNEFINSYRVEEAKERLLKESTSITAIAFEVGFSSIASFNRVFKAMQGCSPTEYRAGLAV